MRVLVRQVLIAPTARGLRRVVDRRDDAERRRARSLRSGRTSVSDQVRAPHRAIVLGAKVNALLDGRAHVSFDDIGDVVLPALRHRLILNFQAEAENVDSDRLITEVVRGLRRP